MHLNSLMYTISVFEYARIPIEVEDVEETTDAVIVDPEYTVVELRRRVRIVV